MYLVFGDYDYRVGVRRSGSTVTGFSSDFRVYGFRVLSLMTQLQFSIKDILRVLWIGLLQTVLHWRGYVNPAPYNS